MHSLPKLLKITPISSISLPHANTPRRSHPASPSHTRIHTHTCSQSHTRSAVRSAAAGPKPSRQGGSSGGKRKPEWDKGKEDGRRRGANRSTGTGTRKERPSDLWRTESEEQEEGRRREEKRGGGTGNAITFSCSGPCRSMGNAPSQGMSTLILCILVWQVFFDSVCCATQLAGCPPVTLCESRDGGLGWGLVESGAAWGEWCREVASVNGQ